MVEQGKLNIVEKELESKAKIKGEAPDYRGDGVAVWIKEDKNGKVYLSISVLGQINLRAFKNDEKMTK